MTKTQNDPLLKNITHIWLTRRTGLIGEMDLKPEIVTKESVRLRMPFNANFCVDEESGLIHGGILTAVLDSAFGLAIHLGCENIAMMATIDLRVDYLRPAKSREDLLIFAECYRETTHVAFVRGRAWFEGTHNEDVVQASGSFVLTRGEPTELLNILEQDA